MDNQTGKPASKSETPITNTGGEKVQAAAATGTGPESNLPAKVGEVDIDALLASKINTDADQTDPRPDPGLSEGEFKSEGGETEVSRAEGRSRTKDVPFFNPFDGIRGRDGGPYLDFEERANAEVRRAAVEGREADLEGSCPATAGTPLTVASRVEDNTFSNPSVRSVSPLDKDFKGADPVSVLPVDDRRALDADEQKETESNEESLRKTRVEADNSVTGESGITSDVQLGVG